MIFVAPEWLSKGALHHNPNAYLQSERRQTHDTLKIPTWSEYHCFKPNNTTYVRRAELEVESVPLINAGVNLERITALVGHESLETTRDYANLRFLTLRILLSESREITN